MQEAPRKSMLRSKARWTARASRAVFILKKLRFARLDFPTGLSAIQGDIVFDATRLYFENVSAEAGGGTLQLSGSVNYAESPLRYDITLHSDRLRIRYPVGMSWLVGGSLRLTGSTTAGVLSGKVTIERVTLTQGLEVAGMLVSAKEGITGPSTTSPFLRNLQFDVEAVRRRTRVWNGPARGSRRKLVCVCVGRGSTPSFWDTSTFSRGICTSRGTATA